MSSDLSALPEPSPKRRRIAQSCIACRHKKTRCDSLRPACSSCRAKGLSCEYEQDSLVAIPASTLARIEARLSKLEQLTPGFSDEGPRRAEPSKHQHGDAVNDGACAVTETSAAVIIKNLKHAVPSGKAASPTTSTEPSHGTTYINTDSLWLPERPEADILLESYARQVYPLFPILHLPTLRVNYNRIWQTSQLSNHSLRTTSEDVLLYATLNMILALGRLNSTSNEPRKCREQAMTFYERARRILTLDAIDSPSLETIQYCLLTTQYLMFTSRFNRCHSAIGIAIRAAQCIGLDNAVETGWSQPKREMARRVWHSCMLFERLVCSLFGRRVTSFTDSAVPLPIPIDDENFSEDGISPRLQNLPSVTVAFEISLNIFRIIEDARWITVPKEHISLDELTAVLRLSERLDRIQESLPAHLQFSTIADNSLRGSRHDVFILQHVAIMIRIAHVRLLLLRSCILEAARLHSSLQAEASSPPRTTDRLRMETCHICVQAAIDTIDLLDENLRAPLRVMSCIALFTAFSAATVLIAASLIPELEDRYELPGNRITQVMNVLTSHRWQIDGVASAIEHIEQYMKTVDDIKARRVAPRGLSISGSNGPEPIPNKAQAPSDTSGIHDESTLGMQGDAFFDFDLSDPLWDLDWNVTADSLGL